MKIIIYSVLSLLFLELNHSYAQLSKSISVPILKEDKKIDDLMDIVLISMNASDQTDKRLLNDSCLMIEIFKWKDNTISFQIIRNSKPVMNFRINRLEYDKANYGYFSFKGNKIFVWTNDSFSDFFSKTDNYQTFNFIYYSNNLKATQEELYPNTIHYKFADGHFSTEGPPVVEAPIKSGQK